MAKQITTSFQPDPQILAVLKEQAGIQDRSVSKLINLYLRKAFIQEGLLQPKEPKKK
jgi:hypothetical protein